MEQLPREQRDRGNLIVITTNLKIASSALKNVVFQGFLTMTANVEFCGDPSGSDPYFLQIKRTPTVMG